MNPEIQYGVKNIYSKKRVEKLHLNLKKEMLANYRLAKKQHQYTASNQFSYS